MVVLVVDHVSIDAYEYEGDSPIAANPNGPRSLSCTLERMQQTGKGHVLRRSCGVKATQNQTKPFRMLSLNAGS